MRRLAEAVVFPASTDEVAGVVAVCAAHGVAVTPRGAGTGYAGGASADGGVILNLCRMTGVSALETEAQRIAVEAGVVTAQVHARRPRRGLYYPPDPGSSSTSTIGGNVACNAAGPHTLRYGTTVDYVAGLTVVLADGRVVRLGEGADAPQLIPLLCGSEGTLAVVTEVVLRLIPAPAGAGHAGRDLRRHGGGVGGGRGDHRGTASCPRRSSSSTARRSTPSPPRCRATSRRAPARC